MVTPDDALAMARRVLRDHAAGEASRALTAEEAQAVHAEASDLRRQLGLMQRQLEASRKRLTHVAEQADQYVAQVVAEEARAVRAEAMVEESCARLAVVLQLCRSRGYSDTGGVFAEAERWVREVSGLVLDGEPELLPRAGMLSAEDAPTLRLRWMRR